MFSSHLVNLVFRCEFKKAESHKAPQQRAQCVFYTTEQNHTLHKKDSTFRYSSRPDIKIKSWKQLRTYYFGFNLRDPQTDRQTDRQTYRQTDIDRRTDQIRPITGANSTYFGQTYCPSSGFLILYSQQMVFVVPVMLTVCQRGQDGIEFHSDLTKIKLKNSAFRWLLL